MPQIGDNQMAKAYIGGLQMNGTSDEPSDYVVYGLKMDEWDSGNTTFGVGEYTENVQIPSSVTEISDYGLYGYKASAITVPDSVTGIGKYSFAYSTAESLTLPSVTSVTRGDRNYFRSIGDHAFAGMANLKQITIPFMVSDYECDGLFSGCSSLSSITLASGEMSYPWGGTEERSARLMVSDYMFYGCSALTSIGEGFQYGYGRYRSAFEGCSSLTSINHNDGRISVSEFKDCTSLSAITFSGNTEITELGHHAFHNCTSLSAIPVPITAEVLGPQEESGDEGYCFEACSSLTSVTLSGTVRVGNGVFKQCTSLESVVFPDTVKEVGWAVFEDCSALTSVTFNSVVPPTNGGDMFYNLEDTSGIVIYVPCQSLEAYRNATNWSDFSSNFAPLECPIKATGVDANGNTVYVRGAGNVIDYNDSFPENMVSVSVAEGIEGLRYAFQYNDTLTSATIPDGVKYIDSSFVECPNITGATIGCVFPPNVRDEQEGLPFNGEMDSYSYPLFVPSGSVDSYKAATGWRFMASRIYPVGATQPSGVKCVLNLTGGTSVTVNISGWDASLKTSDIEQYRGSLESIVVGPNVTSVNISLWGYNNVTGITFSGESVINFGSIGKLIPIFVQPNLVDAYKSANADSLYGYFIYPIGATEPSGTKYTITLANGNTVTGASSWDMRVQSSEVSGYSADAVSFVAESGVTTVDLSNFSALTSVTLPDTVGDIKLYHCGSLSDVTIPSGVKKFNENTFNGCSGITSIVIPEGVNTIGWAAFKDCTALSSVTIPTTVGKIDQYAFSGTALTGLTLSQTPPEIAGNSFTENSQFPIFVPAGLVDIYREALPDYAGRIHAIGSSEPTGLKYTLTLSDESVVTGAASWDMSITTNELSEYQNGAVDLVVEDGVLLVNLTGFTSLTSVTIADSVQNVIVNQCESLTNVKLPKNLKKLDNSVFYQDSSLVEVKIPSTVTEIGPSAFDGCTSLSAVSIPYGVTYIGSFAFSNCSALTDVVIPETVKEIGPQSEFGGNGGRAFYGCTSLTSVTIPDSLEEISYLTFDGCTGLQWVKIGKGVKRIGQEAFGNSNNLDYIQFDGYEPPVLDTWALKGTNDCPVYVPKEVVDVYKATEGWSDYNGRVQAIPAT